MTEDTKRLKTLLFFNAKKDESIQELEDKIARVKKQMESENEIYLKKRFDEYKGYYNQNVDAIATLIKGNVDFQSLRSPVVSNRNVVAPEVDQLYPQGYRESYVSSPNSYGVPNSYEVPNSYGVPSSYGVPNSYGAPNSYRAPNSYGAKMSF